MNLTRSATAPETTAEEAHTKDRSQAGCCTAMQNVPNRGHQKDVYKSCVMSLAPPHQMTLVSGLILLSILTVTWAGGLEKEQLDLKHLVGSQHKG